MAGANKLLTAGGGGVILTPATSIASDKTMNIPSIDGTLIAADASGNVGIGTSSPQSTFQVGSINAGTSESTNKGLVMIQSAPSSIDSAGGLEFKTSSSGSGYGWKIGGLNAAGDPFVIGNRSNSATFTERARIDSSGNLLVGTTSGSAQLVVNYTYPKDGANWKSSSTATHTAIAFGNPNGVVGAINTSGSTTAYVTSSDYRLKENVAPMTGALSVVQQLKPVTYNWKADGSDGQGFIAHELQAVVPECVVGAKDAVDTDGNPVYQGIDTSFLVATLTAAIQEQQAQIEQLKADVALLKGQA